ncbi:MAG: zinc ribbon domain-containing protein, partial [Promethearchaeota archaeon]
CSNCGFKHATLKLPEREWTCPECGIHHDRDENAAKNLDIEGKRILSEERNIKIITSTVGTTGSHASGDRVRPIVLRVTSPAREAVVDEGRIHCL